MGGIPMSEPRESKRVPHLGRFRLDGWAVHQDQGTLISEDRLIRLEPRVMDVLACLAAEPGAVVSKEDLLEIGWGGAFVEEGALAQAIHSLRKALGDDARQPRFIQTIPKRGYRLVASVVPEVTEPEPDAIPPGELPAPAAVPITAPPRRWRVWLLAGIAFLIVVTILGLVRERTRQPQAVEKAPTGQGNSWAQGPHSGRGPQGYQRTPPQITERRRIVVLPFENLNGPRGAFLAGGLTEEIRNNLASLPFLEVISRTSAAQYEKSYKSLPEIARELKVDYVLEGTVQWAVSSEGRPRVRIRSQLVRAADDTQVWADGFDREIDIEMKDLFAVESEISRKVIAHLGVFLSWEHGLPDLLPDPDLRKLRVAVRATTENLDAYQAYLRGLELRDQPYYSKKGILQAISMFERATALDPHFAAAWAELSQSHCYLELNHDLPPNGIEMARKELERAVALEPGLQSVWLARISFVYRCERDDDAALKLLTMDPQLGWRDSEALQTLGFVLRRKGRFEETAWRLRRAYSLDPKSATLASEIAETYRAMRSYEEADRFYLQAISMAPDKSDYWEGRVLTRLSWTGDVTKARALLTQTSATADPEILAVRFKVDFFARDYPKAVSQLTPERLHALPLVDQYRLKTLAVIARERMGDRMGARVLAEENRAELQNLMKLDPRQPFYPAFLAVTLAELGQDAEALALAEKTARETQGDAYAGANFIELQAMAEAILGHRKEAVGRLSRLLVTQYRRAISANDLRLDPVWDSLRGDPEFEDLLRKSTAG